MGPESTGNAFGEQQLSSITEGRLTNTRIQA